MVKVIKKKRAMTRQPRPVYELEEHEENDIIDGLVRMYSSVGAGVADDPLLKAKQVLKQCLTAKLPSGKPWTNAPMEFEGRLRFFGYDPVNHAPIDEFWVRLEAKKIKPQVPDPADQIPDELIVPKGADPIASASLISFDEAKEYDRIYAQFLQDYPEIELETDKELLRLLVKQMVILNRITSHVMMNGKTSNRATYHDEKIIQSIEKLQKALGIDRATRDARQKEAEAGSVAELVCEWEEYIQSGEFERKEVEFFIEEACLLLRKMDREWPDGSPEISEMVFQRLMGYPSSVIRKVIANPYYSSMEELMAAINEEQKIRAIARANAVDQLSRMGIKTNSNNRLICHLRALAEGVDIDLAQEMFPVGISDDGTVEQAFVVDFDEEDKSGETQ